MGETSAEVKVSELQGDKKSCLWGVSPRYAGRDAAFFFFGRDRCRYVWRDAAMYGEMPLFENIPWVLEAIM
jgi:hypothetical protein